AFLGKPTIREFMPGADAPVSVADSYGQRLRGYVVIPTTGNYRFYIAGDDRGELWIAESGSCYDRRKVAWHHGAVSRLQWTSLASQASAIIPLQAGQRVYVESLHKENTGGDHASLGWSVGGATPVLIPSNHLEAFASPVDDYDEDSLSD